MLHQAILCLATGILIITVPPVSSAGIPAVNESECPLTDIDSRLSVAMEIIDTTRRKLPDDLNEMCRKRSCEEKPFNCSECRKCPFEEKPVDCTKCPCEQKPINCTKCPCEQKPINCTKCPCEQKPINCSECNINNRDAKPMDCSDIYNAGNQRDGRYEIWPQSRISSGSLRVYCDMKDGGGWTVIQRRGNFGNPQDYFYNDWHTYKIGFGNIVEEFWIGNDNLFALTNQRAYQIKVDLRDWEGDFGYATYDEFWINDEYHNYTLHVKGYSGTAGDSLARHDGSMFTTKDRDNDSHMNMNCAVLERGAWWYVKCGLSNLNGLCFESDQKRSDGIHWYHFKNGVHTLKETVMKVRPVKFGSLY